MGAFDARGLGCAGAGNCERYCPKPRFGGTSAAATMNVYADTSALLAWFHPADPFAVSMTKWCRDKQPEFCWNEFLRAELRHNLRRLKGRYAAVAWHAYRASESAKRLRLDSHSAAKFFDWADELSSRHASSSDAGTWDFVHVAAAQNLQVDVFVTCDSAQAEVARRAGMTVHLLQ
jgi:predicted nucleic acid-binding protein